MIPAIWHQETSLPSLAVVEMKKVLNFKFFAILLSLFHKKCYCMPLYEHSLFLKWLVYFCHFEFSLDQNSTFFPHKYLGLTSAVSGAFSYRCNTLLYIKL